MTRYARITGSAWTLGPGWSTMILMATKKTAAKAPAKKTAVKKAVRAEKVSVATDQTGEYLTRDDDDVVHRNTHVSKGTPTEPGDAEESALCDCVGSLLIVLQGKLP